jgi:transketolase
MTATESSTSLDNLAVDTIRTLSMDAVQKANSGHPGTPMALAPLAYVLYTRVMRHNPRGPDWPDRDRFVLSAGHASMLLYSTLYLSGYDVSLENDIEQFRQLGSRAAGHPEYHDLPGIEVTTGPLGQGISHSVGLALAERMLAARFNRDGHDVVDHHTFVIASDGDLEEGISGEASSLAGHLQLGRLISFYDQNHISIEGDTALAFSEDVGERYEAYGWHVQDLEEDIALDRLEQALRDAMAVEDKPSLIIVRTHIAQGSPNKHDTAGAHGSPLGEEEIKLTKEAIGWPSQEPFFVPEDALKHFQGQTVERGAELEAEWNKRFDAYAEAHPELAQEFKRLVSGDLPPGWDDDVPRFHASGSMTATRKSSQTVIQWAAAQVPELVGGSADLAPSTLTLIDNADSVEPGDYGGRNLHFGIREHAMGAIVNGLNLHYLRAFGATFFTFSDYMRGSIRLAALMKLGSIFVYTHDSIGLGEDGPTHQPIEHLAGLRAMPTLSVVRPAGANETALAWRYAIATKDSPTALVLSRQGVPTWNPSAIPADAIERGAYTLRFSFKEPEPDLILISTGTEVHICTAAADILESEGIATRVVSMPCMEHFADQDQAYRDEVLPPSCRARVSVEAAATFGWHRWVGELGEAIGMETFGASGPAGALYKHFGFTPEKVSETARAVVKRAKT